MPVPTSGPSPVVLLEIRGTTLMMIGGRGTLTAWQIEDGRAREVAARWTADGDAISITSGGVVSARRLGHATVHAQHDDHRGTETVHVVTSVAGIWRGSLSVIDCWQVTASAPDPCEGRRGLTAPLVVTVSQSAAAELGNLTATIAVFTPPATGRFVGLLDSQGTFFLQGHVEREGDGLSGGVTFRWQLDGETLVPMTINEALDDTVDVGLSSRSGAGSVCSTKGGKYPRSRAEQHRANCRPITSQAASSNATSRAATRATETTTSTGADQCSPYGLGGLDWRGRGDMGPV